MGRHLMKNLLIDVSVYGEKDYKLFLDIVKQELDASKYTDVTAPQALLLLNMNENVVTIGEVLTRGYYIGTNASYSIRRLVKAGYITSEKSDYDKRNTYLKLTPKGLTLCSKIENALEEHIKLTEKKSKNKIDLNFGLDFLKRLERFFLDILHYRK